MSECGIVGTGVSHCLPLHPGKKEGVSVILVALNQGLIRDKWQTIEQDSE